MLKNYIFILQNFNFFSLYIPKIAKYVLTKCKVDLEFDLRIKNKTGDKYKICFQP